MYFKENVKYNLSSIIACPFSGHYTSIIFKYRGIEYDGLLKKIETIIMMILKIMDVLLN